MVDAHFSHPRLAELSDPLDPDRTDLDPYVALCGELGAAAVLDIGCGTGTLACRLARQGRAVTGLDPAAASLAVARRKPGAEQVRWVCGTVDDLSGLQVDLVTMTGNVAQVFVTDAAWAALLAAAHRLLVPGGHLVFEVRDPVQQAWREWDRDRTRRRVAVAGAGTVETWVDTISVRPPLVSFRTSFVFEEDGVVLTSDSTLRFRRRAAVEESLRAAGFVTEDVRGAPDRPGQELVFVAARPSAG